MKLNDMPVKDRERAEPAGWRDGGMEGWRDGWDPPGRSNTVALPAIKRDCDVPSQ